MASIQTRASGDALRSESSNQSTGNDRGSHSHDIKNSHNRYKYSPVSDDDSVFLFDPSVPFLHQRFENHDERYREMIRSYRKLVAINICDQSKGNTKAMLRTSFSISALLIES